MQASKKKAIRAFSLKPEGLARESINSCAGQTVFSKKCLTSNIMQQLLNGILNVPHQWGVSHSIAYSPWHFVPRKHVPGRRQGPRRLMSLRNNSLIKWMGTRVTSSAHFMNLPALQMPLKVMQWWRPELFLSTQVISLSEEPCLSIRASQSPGAPPPTTTFPCLMQDPDRDRGAEHLCFFTMTQPSITSPAMGENGLDFVFYYNTLQDGVSHGERSTESSWLITGFKINPFSSAALLH